MTSEESRLRREINQLKAKVCELTEIIDAMTTGSADALVVKHPSGSQIYTIEAANDAYRIMIEEMNEGALSLCKDGIILYCNRRFTEILHISPGQLIGKKLIDLLDPATAPIFTSILEDRGNEGGQGEVVLLALDGRKIPALLSLRHVFRESKEIISVIITDLTAQKRNREIEAAASMTNVILDQASDAVLVCDPEGVIIRANQAAQSLAKKNPLFKKISDVFALGVKHTDYVRGLDVEFPTKGGESKHHMMVSISPLTSPDDQSKNIGTVVTMTDVSKIKIHEVEAKKSRDFLRTTLGSIGDGVVATNAMGIITLINPVAAKICHCAPEEALGMPFKEVFKISSHSGNTDVRDIITQVLDARSVLTLPDNSELQTKNGALIPIEDHAAPILDDSGKITGVVLTFRDVTEKRKAFSRLAKSEELLNQAQHIAQLGSWHWDVKTGTFTGSSEFQRLFGVNPELQEPQGIWAQLEVLRKKSLESGEGYATELEGTLRNNAGSGTSTWVKCHGELERDVSGQIIGMSGTVQDITELKKIEIELNFAKKGAEEANKLKSEFLALMSHEIRTPVTAILGFSELVTNPEETLEERKSYSERIRRNGEHLLRLIDDILDLSKIEVGRMEIDSVQVNLNETIGDVFRTLLPLATAKGIHLNLTMDPSLPVSIMTDRIRLRQILINIIGNAIKFTRVGSVKVRVKVSASDADKKLHIIVTDTGIGLTETQVQGIFQLFIQGDSSITRKYGGTGLGLALSRKLAQALGGDVILAENRGVAGPNHGCTFEITIAMTDATYQEKPVPVSADNQPSANLDGIKVLVVESNPELQYLINRYVRSSGGSVDLASSGEDGVVMALSGNYDAVLMDIWLPVMNGREATRTLRAKGYKTPIVALTNHAMQDEVKLCEDAGCTTYLPKPINRTDLVSMIAKIVRH